MTQGPPRGPADSTAPVDIHQLPETLWRSADTLRGQVDAAEYKHVVLGLLLVRVLVEMLEPYSGRIYDPCCGSGG